MYSGPKGRIADLLSGDSQVNNLSATNTVTVSARVNGL